MAGVAWGIRSLGANRACSMSKGLFGLRADANADADMQEPMPYCIVLSTCANDPIIPVNLENGPTPQSAPEDHSPVRTRLVPNQSTVAIQKRHGFISL